MRGSRARLGRAGFTLIELLVVVFIVGMLTAIAIPNILSAQRRSRYTQAAADTKTAVTQTMVYALDKSVYPASIQVLRKSGLASISDNDPWGIPLQLAPALLAGNPPGEEAYIFSKGPYGTGTCPNPFTSNTGAGGSVGDSSVYGVWTGTWRPAWPVFLSSAVLPARATTLRAWGAMPPRGSPLADGRRCPARSMGCKGWARISAPDHPEHPKGCRVPRFSPARHRGPESFLISRGVWSKST